MTVNVNEDVPDILPLPRRAAVEVLNVRLEVPDIAPGAEPVRAAAVVNERLDVPERAVEPRSVALAVAKDSEEVPDSGAEPLRVPVGPNVRELVPEAKA
jgi:hypothetical protein